jgi:hypothetical protein
VKSQGNCLGGVLTDKAELRGAEKRKVQGETASDAAGEDYQ